MLRFPTIAILALCAAALPAADADPVPVAAEAPVPAAAKPAQLTLDELPAAVRTAIEKQAVGAAIEGIHAGEVDGVRIFVATIVRDGAKTELHLNPLGETVRMKAERKDAAEQPAPTSTVP